MKPLTLMTLVILTGCAQPVSLNPKLSMSNTRAPSAASLLGASELSGVDASGSGSTDDDTSGVTDEVAATVAEDGTTVEEDGTTTVVDTTEEDGTSVEDGTAVVVDTSEEGADTKTPCTIVSCPAGTGCQQETGLCMPECESPGVACSVGAPFCLPAAPPFWVPLCVECINDFSCKPGVACEYNICWNN